MPTAASTPSILCLAAALALTGCAGAGTGASFSERDPYEDTNRSFHEFNLALDRNVLRPVSQGYDTVTPTLIQHLLGNAFSHLDTVGDFANYLLQGEMEAAGTALGRLTVNTILGAGGALDPATEFGLPKEDTDFGVTLGRHGVEEGAYLVLPFLGPSTTRDLAGRVVDRAFDPTTYIGLGVEGTAVDVTLPASGAVEVIDDRNRNADLIDDVLYESEDSYISLRTIYLQRRDALIAGGDDAGAALPDIFDDDEAPAN
mgnify:CR=1 FL=1